ncbi:glucosamine fructose-6-phosphate aminotransferase1 [Zea mays]|uniref:Protein FAR1-RELATED SEQUENCE n=1 Tax=Zea mays TaxID=4577 RepID=A0A1D6NQD3_MAIZE|nr:glucosamine fructose-6-phosphate aminotransferase1 [Zea mays]ONM42143.1 glucosamine fructose-6-phosphate aminotransferase1 [Zea mays]
MVMVMEGGRTEGDELIADYVDCLMSLDTNTRPVHSDGLILGAPGGGGGTVDAGTEPDAMRDIPSSEDPNEPVLGMTFESDEAAKAFYNDYARRLGFPFRVGRSRRSKGTEEVVVMKRFVCSREGVYKKKQTSPDEAARKRERMSMREGCNAMMEVVREADHWVVSKLEKAHNHELGTCSAKFDLSLAGRYEDEAKADMDAYLNKATTKTASLIEKQAAGTYTKAVFSRFQEEFTESLGFIIQKTEDGCISKYSITKYEDPSDTFCVTYNASNKMANCSCKYFEFSGILCRHILGVYIIVDPRTLPTEYFMKRWTRKARDDDALLEDNNNNTHDEDASQSTTSRYNTLCADAIRCAEKGAGSEAVYKAAKDILQKAYEEIIAYERNTGQGSQRDVININEDVTIDDAMNDKSMPDSGRKNVRLTSVDQDNLV